MHSNPKETYLGDGLYASFDGYMVWLRAPREDGDHKVALEPPVLDNFLRYLSEHTPFELSKFTK